MSLYDDVDASKTRKKSSKGFACLLSLCVFLLVVCVCLMTVLVFVGKFILYGTCDAREHRSLLEKEKHKHAGFPQKEFWRLPGDTEPISYDLTLLPHLDKNHFKGSVNITLTVSKARKDIVLHGEGFLLSDVSLRNERLESFEILNTEAVPEYGVIVVTTKKKISPAIYYLSMKFRKSFSKHNAGIYISQYKSSNGTNR